MSILKSPLLKPLALVVDDDLFMRTLVSRCAERAGFDVITAVNGKDGFEEALKSNPQMIFSDIDMPVWTGIEMVRALRSKGIQTPVLVISGNQAWNAEEISLIGGSGFLSKPYDLKQFFTTVAGLWTTYIGDK
jgi:CheY-like chemotaxis protein